MRGPSEFSAREWLLLKPFHNALRQIRNDLFLRRYLRATNPELRRFLEQHRHLRGRNLVVAIAFERPWVIDWLLRMAKRNLRNAELIIVDNSRFPKERAEIEAVCRKHGTPYLTLPPYKTHHVNRSHGMAMSWIVQNLFRPLEPNLFAFIDHDLIPVAPVDFAELMGDQPVYGLFKPGLGSYWHLWAGYCAYRLADFPAKGANFLYDFCRDLDTGGRLWTSVYSRLDRKELRFADDRRVELKPPGIDQSASVQIIDHCWMHFEGIGYNDNFEKRGAFFAAMEEALESGRPWQELQVGR